MTEVFIVKLLIHLVHRQLDNNSLFDLFLCLLPFLLKKKDPPSTVSVSLLLSHKHSKINL